MGHSEILEDKIKEFREDKSILGVMLMGSVADGTATQTSDLDLFLLSSIDKFEAEFTDKILVECSYMKYKTALYKLQNVDMEVYRYINSRILYDNGQINELMTLAYKKFRNYIADAKMKKGIYHWLVSTKIKLQSAMKSNNILRMNFLTATNSWEVIEAVWAVNNRPMPPSGSVTKFLNEITIIPKDNWFEQLFTGSDYDKAMNVLYVIDWVLPKLTL